MDEQHKGPGRPKKKLGRPRNQMSRDHRISTDVDNETLARLDDVCKARAIARAIYLRQALMDALYRDAR